MYAYLVNINTTTNKHMITNFLNYLQYEKRSSIHTVSAYENDLKQFNQFCLNHLGVNEEDFDSTQVKFDTVRAFVVQLIDNKITPRSVNRKIASINAYYKFLLQKELISELPTKKLKALKLSKRLPSFVKQQEIDHLFNPSIFAENKYPDRDRLIIELLYGTGIRLSELINIKVSDINFANNTLKVLGKRNKERLIPLHQELIESLKSFIATQNKSDGAYLITTPKHNKAYPSMIQKIVKTYLSKVSSSEKKSPHVLRHTFATHLLNNGAELNAIKDLLGHSNLAATQIYTHNSISRLKKIFNKTHPKS